MAIPLGDVCCQWLTPVVIRAGSDEIDNVSPIGRRRIQRSLARQCRLTSAALVPCSVQRNWHSGSTTGKLITGLALTTCGM